MTDMEKNIEALIRKAAEAEKADDAMKFSQAAPAPCQGKRRLSIQHAGDDADRQRAAYHAALARAIAAAKEEGGAAHPNEKEPQ